MFKACFRSNKLVGGQAMLSNLTIAILLLRVTQGLDLNKNQDSRSTNSTGKVERFLQSTESNVSILCKQHLTQYMQALRNGEPWAAEMFGAGAKLKPQKALAENFVDLGSFDTCLDIKHQTNRSTIHGKYCIAKMTVDSSLQKMEKSSKMALNTIMVVAPKPSTKKFDVQIAKCFPDSCSAKDMQMLYTHFNFPVVFDEKLCQTKAAQPKLSNGGFATIYAFGVILWIVLVSTVYDVRLHYLGKKPYNPWSVAFSALKNGKRLISTSKSPNDISCLHGIRAINMLWIISHSVYDISSDFALKNLFHQPELVNQGTSIYMLSTPLTIETFFFITGLLISYLFLDGMSKGAKFNIFRHYVHRYFRLTPVFATIMVFHVTLLKLTGSGPLWSTTTQNELVGSCQEHWWKGLLHIQNVFSDGKLLCVPPSWYICVDMQLFLLSPFLLIPLQGSTKNALSALATLTAFSITTCFLIGWFLQLSPSWLLVDGRRNYYYPPYTRATPWLIGIMLGYLIFETKQGKVRLESKVAIAFMWVVSVSVLITCVLVGHQIVINQTNRLASSFHLTLMRPTWVLAIAWVIFACVSGHGGPVNWFLSMKVFQVASKLSYSLYLVHYTVIYVAAAQIRTVRALDNPMYHFWASFGITIVCSLVLHLAIECPMVKIDKYLFGRKERKRT